MPDKNAQNVFAEMVKAEWSAETTINAWRRWHKKNVTQLKPMNEALLAAAAIAQGSKILDIACGAGEPAKSIASLVGPEGQVVATDLSKEMLALARENCQSIDNIDFRQADAHELPFDDNQFDAVTCRLGVMYFWDCSRALNEIHRTLKPGGQAAFVVWGGLEQNALARTMILPFAMRKAPPELPPEAPHPFRFAAPGSLSAELTKAGFLEVQERQQTIACPWPGPPDELWTQLYEMAAPMQPYIDSFDPDERREAMNASIAEFGKYYDGEFTDPTTHIIVATCVKQS